MKFYKCFSLALCLFIAACGTSKKTTTATTETKAPMNEISYKKYIWPIIESKCAVSGCHIQGFYEGDFTIFEQLKKFVDSGKLRRMVIDNKVMPPEQPLDAMDIKLIDTWLKQGGNNN
jgi:hypothetical protein